MSKLKVQLSDQVVDFLRKQAPVPKKEIKESLKKLVDNGGDIKALEGPLVDFYRLRVKTYRIIFTYTNDSIDCIFIEKRSFVYEIFEEILRGKLLSV